MKKTFFSLYPIILGFIILLGVTSCASRKNLAYFNNITRDSVSQIKVSALETLISKNDILQIDISTLDEGTTRILNKSNIMSSGETTKGYLVNESGNVNLPLLGPIKAEGLTKRQLATVITNKLLLAQLAKDPVVSVRIANYKVTVLGEVNKPGVITVPSERITLPEALGQAGDLTIYGRRDNVLLIRMVGNKKTVKRFSLNNDKFFDTDIFNLQNQDIIYVEPNNTRAASSDRSTQLFPLFISGISILVLVYAEFVKN